MNPKTILITWATGYIWSHWVVCFEQAWYKTVLIDNFVNSSHLTLDWIENILWYKPNFYEIDLRDKEKLEEIFKKYSFDGVIHFAWLKSPFESHKKSLLYFQNNICGSLNLFELMDKYSVKNIVFSSSANTYDASNISPIKEASKQSTTNPYGTTKLLIEKILFDLSKFNKFNVINLRYFNPIWAHISGYLWELPKWKPNNLFPYVFKVLSWEIEELRVFGNNYNTSDWTWVRDYIDVMDLIEAHLLSYNKISLSSQEGYFNNYNVWTWKGLTVLEIIKYVERFLWKKVKYIIAKKREGDIPVSFCDTSKIISELWFKPKISLKESIINSWKFYNS